MENVNKLIFSNLQFYTIEIPRNGANSIDSTDYKVKNKKGKQIL
jgi:hypothetical protein